MVFHEFSHGILSRVGGLKVKALGILIFGVPVGAFVEPDEDELQMAPRRIRDRVYAAGPGMNIFLGITLLLVFSWGFMGSLQPVHDGMLITSVTKDFPAEKAGLRPGMIITHMECTGIRNESNTTRVVSFSSDIRDLNDFYRFMDSTHANDTVNITVYSNGKLIVFSNITLTDKYRYYPIEEFRGKGFLGVSTVDVRGFRDALAHPVASANGNWMIAFGNILQITLFLPLQTTIMPFHSPITEIYTIEGPLSILPPSVFWMLANLLYYTFWLNFLVGTFNALPAVPLDGGIPFRDTVDYLAEKVGRVKDPLKRERIADTMALWMALIVLFLIIWVLFAPYIL